MFFDEFAGIRIQIKMPDGKIMELREAIGALDLGDILWVPPEPPPFNEPYELVRWQERLKQSNDACGMLGQKLARALKQGFQKRVWESKP